MKLKVTSPTKAFVVEATPEEMTALRKTLSYVNTAQQHLVKRHYNNKWLREKNHAAWEAQLEDLKKTVNCSVLFYGENITNIGTDAFYVRPGSIPYLKEVFPSMEVENVVKYPTPKKIPWHKPLPFTLHPYQQITSELLPLEKHGNGELCTGCHSRGTELLMFDGTLKKVEDVIVGDELMGPDSSPRRVLRLFNGIDDMYKIQPIKGDSFIVNRRHILSLQRTNLGNTFLRKNGTRQSQENGPNPIINVSVEEYLKWSERKKTTWKLYRTSIEFKSQSKLSIPPYILGLWLGDGASSRASLTSMDSEISDEWCAYIRSLGMDITIDQKLNNRAKTFNGVVSGGYTCNGEMQNKFNILLREYNLINNKHIPQTYLVSSKKDRQELLAGLIDTDGYYSEGYFEITQKNNEISKGILFLARSLGLSATLKKCKKSDQNGMTGEYNRIVITGDLRSIPTKLKRKKAPERLQKKNVLRTGFKVEYVNKDEYFGFELDSDHLYVMGDFTVTHNSGKSAIILQICRETGFKAAIIAPSKSIFHELLDKFEYHFGKGAIGTFGDGKKKLGKRFTICIADSIANIKPGSPEWDFFSGLDMLIADESHTWGAETLDTICHGVLSEIPYRFFLSGTQTRGDGAEKLLQSIIGRTVHTLTTKEAIAGGFISDHEFRIIDLESSNPSFYASDALMMKRTHFLGNKNIAAFVAKLATASAANKQQTLVLVEELSQIATLNKLLAASGITMAYAHSESKKDRLLELGLEKVDPAESVEKFNKGEAMVLVGTSCISTGTNIYPMSHTINWVGGSSEIKTKQGAIGRTVRLWNQNPWKDKCLPVTKKIIWDFKVRGVDVMDRHLDTRIEYYQDSGSTITHIKLKK